MSACELIYVTKEEYTKNVYRLDVSQYVCDYFRFDLIGGILLGYISYEMLHSQNGIVALQILSKAEPHVAPDLELFYISGCHPSKINSISTDLVSTRKHIRSIIHDQHLYEYSAGDTLLCALATMMMHKFGKLDRPIQKYESLRMEKEKAQFMQAIHPFLEQPNLNNLKRLLLHNGYSEELFICGTITDNETTLRRSLYVPKFYLDISILEVPTGIGLSLPLYPNGRFHLHPSDAGHWLWNRSIGNCKMLGDLSWASLVDDERILHNLVWPALHMVEAAHMKRPREGDSLSLSLKDVQLPVCLRYDRWIKNEERKNLIPILRNCGISKDECHELMSSLSGLSIQETIAKNDYTSYFKKSYSHKLCSDMIENRATKGFIPKCPYKGDETSCKSQCVAELSSPYLSVDILRSPVQYIKKSKYRKRKKHVEIKLEK